MSYTTILATLLLLLANLDMEASRLGRITIDYEIEVHGQASDLVIMGMLPKDIPNRQRIVNLYYGTEKAKSYTKNGNRYFSFSYDKIANSKKKLKLACDFELFEYDWQKANEYDSRIREEPDRSTLKLGYSGHCLKLLRKLSAKMTGVSTFDKVGSLMEIVSKTLDYDNSLLEDIPLQDAIRLGRGDCTEYAELLVALCRLEKIPARMVSGYVLNSETSNSAHNWAEVFIEDVGWIPLDPTAIDASPGVPFHQFPNNYLYLDRGDDQDLIKGNTAWQWKGNSETVVDLQVGFDFDFSKEENFKTAVLHYRRREYVDAQNSLNRLISKDEENVHFQCLQMMIDFKRNMKNSSRQNLQKAMNLSNHQEEKILTKIYATRYFALEGKIEMAQKYLETAFLMGFRDVPALEDDPDLTVFRGTREYQDLVKKFGAVAMR